MEALNFSTYRMEEIGRKLNAMGAYPLDVMVTGVTGAGKSTTLNSFFQSTVTKVGDGVDPETMELGGYELNDYFRIWDTPGLGDGPAIDQEHKRKMIDLLYDTYTIDGMKYGLIDMVVVIIEGANRDMGTTYTLLNEVIVPNMQKDRVFVVINQADVAMKGRHWNRSTQTPDSQLIAFLDEQAASIQKRIEEATGVSINRPVYYSAEYGWNVRAMFDFIIDHIPTQRRCLVK